MTVLINNLLSELEAPGTFATRLSAPADNLNIEVKGVGKIIFPITPEQALRIRNVARPSPFGLRDQTLHDTSVRNTWEITKSRVRIAARQWKTALTAYMKTLQTELGFPDGYEVNAVLDKLLIYEEGQFFKPHQDSEKDDDMVGTLVVILPSEYEGGTLTVEHRGEKKVFRRVASQAKYLSLLAFYADCHHAVSPIKKGIRVAITYQLKLTKRTSLARPHIQAEVNEPLTLAISKYFATPIVKLYSRAEPALPERFIYLLDHEYTQRSLSWFHLKNGDRGRVLALTAAANHLDCECFLALAEVHEIWMCEDDYPYGYDRHENRRYHRVDDAPKEHELIELQESQIELNHWLDSDGRLIEGIPVTANNDELHFTKPSRDIDPFRSEHEGYQGNYGNTVDRWYHRAAFVMWPRANTFKLTAQASPQWAVDELLALPPQGKAELESRVLSLLPGWKYTAGRVTDAAFFAKLIECAALIDDPNITRDFIEPIGFSRLTDKPMRSGLAALVEKHGLIWAQGLFDRWAEHQPWETPAWAPLLTDLCAELHAAKNAANKALAIWLLEKETMVALERCFVALRQPTPWLDLDSFGNETTHLAHVLAAGVAISNRKIASDSLNKIPHGNNNLPLPFLVQLLTACLDRSPALRAYIIGSALHQQCTKQLDAELDVEGRTKHDWSIIYPLGCTCTDCKELSKFLRSSGTAHDLPLNKERRQHIHQKIDSSKLPILHTTLRRGSPYTLQLRKDRSLFSRERAYRLRVNALRSALPAYPSI